MRKLVVEGGWVQVRMYDVGWLEVRSVVVITKKKAHRNTCYIIARHG